MTNCVTEQIETAPKRRGRPPEADPTESHTITARRSRWTWLRKWASEGSSESKCFEFLLERLENVYPEGPGRIGHAPDAAETPKTRTTPAVAREAARRGITKAEMINELWRAYQEREGAK